MTIAFSAAALISGSIVAIVARFDPDNARSLQRWGARLLIAGIVLMGLAFPTPF